MATLMAKNLVKTYFSRIGGSNTKALNGVDIEINEKEFV